MDFSLIATFFLLVGLELVLGVDNIIMVMMVSSRCDPKRRALVQKLGLGLAAAGRIMLLASITWVLRLTEPVVTVMDRAFSWKDIGLLAGGLFLLAKAVKEIHHAVEHPVDSIETPPGGHTTVFSAVIQMLLLDLVFSIDSVITAVGLTTTLWVMIAAVLASVVLILTVSGPIIRFVQCNPGLKVLALAFLVVVGVTIIMEGMHQHVPKHLIYMPLGFCLAIELLQMRQSKHLRSLEKGVEADTSAVGLRKP